jgi:hypothetical protein
LFACAAESGFQTCLNHGNIAGYAAANSLIAAMRPFLQSSPVRSTLVGPLPGAEDFGAPWWFGLQRDLLATTTHLLRLRREHPALSRSPASGTVSGPPQTATPGRPEAQAHDRHVEDAGLTARATPRPARDVSTLTVTPSSARASSSTLGSTMPGARSPGSRWKKAAGGGWPAVLRAKLMTSLRFGGFGGFLLRREGYLSFRQPSGGYFSVYAKNRGLLGGHRLTKRDIRGSQLIFGWMPLIKTVGGPLFFN